MREWYQLFLHEWQIKKAKGLSYPKVWLLPDCALEQLFYGVSPAEYFTYEFFQKSPKKTPGICCRLRSRKATALQRLMKV